MKKRQTKAEMLIEINNLTEELIEAGLRTRPTIMSKIEQKESNACDKIIQIVNECEKETGRHLTYPVNPTLDTVWKPKLRRKFVLPMICNKCEKSENVNAVIKDRYGL